MQKLLHLYEQGVVMLTEWNAKFYQARKLTILEQSEFQF